MKDILGKMGLAPDSSVLAISPHPDDAALSCGGFLRCLSGVEITLLTCFSHSIYAPFAGETPLTVESVHMIRSSEDEEYAHRINASRLDLELQDVSLRYSDYSDWLQEKPKLDETFSKLTHLIVDVLSLKSYALILSPLAIGQHVDHYFVREAVRQIGLSHYQVLFYEDLPYGTRIGGVKAAFDYARKVFPLGTCMNINITEFVKMKIADIGVYKSQIYSKDLRDVVEYAAELGGIDSYAERMWFAHKGTLQD